MFWSIVIGIVAVVLLAVWIRDRRVERRAVDSDEALTRLRVSRGDVDHFTHRTQGGPLE